MSKPESFEDRMARHDAKFREEMAALDRKERRERNTFFAFMAAVLVAFGVAFTHDCRQHEQREAYCAEHTTDLRCAGLWR